MEVCIGISGAHLWVHPQRVLGDQRVKDECVYKIFGANRRFEKLLRKFWNYFDKILWKS